MEALIPVLNKLQDVFARVGTTEIHLPQIVVVGSQSSGKSSVLESLVQKDFLPRGSGIVTRRPLILQLNHIDQNEEWAEFLHKPDQKYTDFNLVRKEIEDETDRLCGTGKGVTDVPIGLKVYSPNVLNLTLVDLPGLTKVATEGQDPNLPQLIKDMVLTYVKPENAIILAISPANSDLANSDSLLIAKEVDPKGLRTIGVLTKLDIMDHGTNARDVLLNKVYPLQLGYIGVVNRSQKDIDSKKPMQAVLEAERRFFISNSAYRDIAEQNGYAYLAQTLNHLLIQHIKARLPGVHNTINELLRRKEKELLGYGETFGETIEERQMYLYRTIEHYLEEYSELLLGQSDELRTNGLDGGQYVMDQMVTKFPVKLDQIKPAVNMDRDVVLKMIEVNSGLQRNLFFPEPTFYQLVKQMVEAMRQPAIEATEIVHHRLMELHQKVHLNELDRFPQAKVQLAQAVTDVARQHVEECLLFVNEVIDIQTAYIDPAHPALQERTASQLKSGNLESNVDLLLELVDRYFGLCKKEVSDVIPKVIHRILIKGSTESLRYELFQRLVLNPQLQEDPDVAARRKKCVTLIKALKEASSILNEVRMVRL